MDFMVSTPMGAEVVLEKAPDYLGDGIILQLRMHKITDSRRAEVFLDQESIMKVKTALEAFMSV